MKTRKLQPVDIMKTKKNYQPVERQESTTIRKVWKPIKSLQCLIQQEQNQSAPNEDSNIKKDMKKNDITGTMREWGEKEGMGDLNRKFGQWGGGGCQKLGLVEKFMLNQGQKNNCFQTINNKRKMCWRIDEKTNVFKKR